MGQIDPAELARTAEVIDAHGAAPEATIRAQPAGVDAAMLSALPHLGVGGEGDIVVHDVLGEGGMGIVTLASQRALEREVAVKRVRPERASARARAALVAEARITGGLEHPNVVPVHALGRDDGGEPVLVMKKLSGTSWRELLRDPDHPDLPRGPKERLAFHVGILMQVCHALHYAHSRDVIHRDIKPDNVMIGGFGEVYLLDWGVAYRRRDDAEVEHSLTGSLAYMAPEMLGGSGPFITARTDVYLLGATLYEVLTGKRLHTGKNTMQIVHHVLSGPPPELDDSVPEELAELCRRATRSDPDARPESALAFRQALADYLSHRASIDLADTAKATLVELQRVRDELRRGRDGDDERDLERRLEELWGECRFAYQQALQSWPANERARAGLAYACELVLEHALDRREPRAAERLLAVFPTPPRPDLLQKLEALRSELASESRELGALRREALERDVRVGTPARASSVLVSLAFVLGVWGASELAFPGGIGNRTLAVAFAVVTLGYVVIAAVAKERMLPTAVARHIYHLVVGSAAACAFNHVLGAILGAGVPHAIVGDLLLCAAAATSAGVLVGRGFAFSAVPFIGAAALVPVLPAHALRLFMAALVLNNVFVAWLYRRWAGEATARKPH
jgi:serine/threonine-protein kinase